MRVGPAGAVRRFFYVDGRLGYSTNKATPLLGVQYPKYMYLSVVLRRSPRDTIFVPQLTIA